MEDILLHPIGIIRTPFKDKYAAPRQPFTEGIVAAGKIVLNSGNNFEQAVSDLEGFEKIWLIYQFDRNKNWKPKVLPPRGSAEKRGVFATRSPHRPNPIGLSLVTLLEVKGRTLYVDGVDMLDKTPLFDIKPYLPAVESYPNTKSGWAEGNDLLPQRDIRYEQEAEVDLAAAAPREATGIRDHIEHLLKYDISPHPYKRITLDDDGNYTVALKKWRIRFSLNGDSSVTVLSVRDEDLKI